VAAQGEDVKEEYRPKTQEQKLGYLVEECGEVLQGIGKAQRWGLESKNPEDSNPNRETNRDWILRELNDLERAIVMVRVSLSTRPAPKDEPKDEPSTMFTRGEVKTMYDKVRARADETDTYHYLTHILEQMLLMDHCMMLGAQVNTYEAFVAHKPKHGDTCPECKLGRLQIEDGKLRCQGMCNASFA
jgi:NTP pyrophosphatase (non-canonical NTP hydrolase)